MATKKPASPPAAGAASADRASGALYLICGEDEYRVKAAARQRVDELCPPADQAFGLEIVNGTVDNGDGAVTALRRCVGALRTSGFLGGRKTVWLQDANFFSDTNTIKGEAVKTARDAFAQELKRGLGPNVALVISAGKVDGRSAFAKVCKELAAVTSCTLPEKSYQQEGTAREWAAEAFRRAGLRLSRDVLEAFVQRAGTDSRQIATEVEKLAIYLGDRHDVRAEDIRLLIAPAREAEYWDLADAVGERQLAEAIALGRQLLFQDPKGYVGLMISLENRFRELLLLHDCLERGWLRVVQKGSWTNAEWRPSPEVETALSALDRDPRATHPFRTAKLAAQTRNFSRLELQRGLNETVAAHGAILGGASAPETVLELLLLKLLRPAKRAAR